MKRNTRDELCRAARRILDAGDNIEDIKLREAGRDVGVTANATYRHFLNKEALLAAVAAKGFLELAAGLRAAASGPDPAIAVGLAYVDFALASRGLFRLMFGQTLRQKDKYPELSGAIAQAQDAMGHSGSIDVESHVLAAWGLCHGLSVLLIGNLAPNVDARALAQRILSEALCSRDVTPPAIVC